MHSERPSRNVIPWLPVAMLLLAACTPQLQAIVTPTATANPAPADSWLYTNAVHGYSMYLPNGLQVTAGAVNQVSIVVPGNLPTLAVAWIDVEPASGRTTDQVAQAVPTDLVTQGFTVRSMVLGLDNAQAYVFDGIPGQDPTRQVFIVHGDTLYRLSFTPDDPQAGQAYQDMEKLYGEIISTFHFTR